MNLNFKTNFLYSNQGLFETSNLENITYDGFKGCSHDDHLSSLDDLIAFSSPKNDSFEDPHAHSHQKINKLF